MNVDELREFIRSKKNKVEKLNKPEVIDQIDMTKKELIKLLSEELTDEEKYQFVILIDYLNNSNKSVIISSMSYEFKVKTINKYDLESFYLVDIINSCNDEEKYAFLQEKKIRENTEIDLHEIISIILGMSDDLKKKIIYSQEFQEWYNFSEYDIFKIAESMTEEYVLVLLEDEGYVKNKISEYHIAELLKKISDKEKCYELGIKYGLNSILMTEIISNCPDKKKEEILLSEENDFSSNSIESILSKFEIHNLFNFLQQHSDFIIKHGVQIYLIVKHLSEENQLQFVSLMGENNIELNQRLKSLVVLKKSVKDKIDKSKMNEDYICAIEIPVIDYDDIHNDDTLEYVDYGFIKVDLDGDLTRYKGLDELIKIRPQRLPFEKYDKLYELCRICPNLRVEDNIHYMSSTASEFLEGEEWIKDVIDNIQEDWSDLQKIAYIDYRIGKKISYTPDFNTEVSNDGAARALWKIIASGYGVCNGIAQIEQYMLNRVGIESEIVSAATHAFLKVNNIEIPRADGTTIVGDTLVDPTWNLMAHRYNGKPNLFARNYEEIRKFDIKRRKRLVFTQK